jgi:hypothetical protein
MTSAWDRVHARYRLVDDVLRRVRRTGNPRLVERWRQPIEEVFGDFGSFLLHLQRQWYTRLTARLDDAHETAPVGTDHSVLVRRAWAQLEAADPAVRAVLDAYADQPELATNEQRLRRRLDGSGTARHREVSAYAS